MLWVTWRQSRTAAVAAGAALLALAATLAITRPGMLALYSDAGLPGCHAGCAAEASRFIRSVSGTTSETIFYAGIVITYLAPALIGLFWGAPLIARELESGTFRLAWNQSVTRQRWAALKLAVVGGAAILTAGLISLMLTWWASPLYAAGAAAGSGSPSLTRMTPALFGATGIASLGYAAFAFALGSAAGMLLRRTLPAMAVTLAVFAAVQVLVPVLVRPHLIPPAQSTQALASVQFSETGEQDGGQLVLRVSSMNGHPADWILGSRPVNAAGQAVTAAPAACRSVRDAFLPCLSRQGIRMAVSYQPASRYWDLQWLETAVYLVAAAGLAGFCYWRVRRPAAAT
jgi:hypothetical protein